MPEICLKFANIVYQKTFEIETIRYLVYLLLFDSNKIKNIKLGINFASNHLDILCLDDV